MTTERDDCDVILNLLAEGSSISKAARVLGLGEADVRAALKATTDNRRAAHSRLLGAPFWPGAPRLTSRSIAAIARSTPGSRPCGRPVSSCRHRLPTGKLSASAVERLPPGVTAPKNKQAPPVKMGKRLTAHMKRWKRMDGGGECVIHSRGKPTKVSSKTWSDCRKAARLPAWVTPHVLRHARATNMMKQGIHPLKQRRRWE